MCKFKLFSIAALALVMAACSNDDNMLETQSPAANGKLRFTATIEAPGTGATTRTEYTEITSGDDAGTINVAWKVNDEIAAIVTNSEDKLVKTVLTVSKVNDDGSAVISGDIAMPKNGEETVDLIYPADIVTVDENGYSISFKKMSDGTTLDGTLKSIYENIDYRRADDCALTVSGEQATLTSAAKLESKLSIWKLTLQDKDGNALSASKVAIAGGTNVLASATLASAGSEVYLPVPADGTSADICIAATTSSNNYFYMKEDVALATGKYYQSTVKMTKGAHLALLLTDEYEAKDGEILTGTLTSNVKISIANNATVTLKDVTINGVNDPSYQFAGITSGNNSTITLEGTNTVKGFHPYFPGIYVPDGNTLTIQGTGSLTANSNGQGAGIGGGYQKSCGNIVIKGGTITATGGNAAAGIGGGYRNSCGNIEISGGTVIATGGYRGAGIGGGSMGSCGSITITSGVTSVTATKDEGAPNSIGAGYNGTCGTVTIGGTEYASGVTQSPYEYSLPALTLTTPAVGQVIGSDGKNYAANATLPTGVTKVAMIASLNGSHGLAIALADESEMMLWSTAVSTAAAHTPAFTGGTWKLPSQDEWKNMFSATGGNSANCSGLNAALATAGGYELKDYQSHWSSSKRGENRAYYVSVSRRGSIDWFPADVGNSTFLVRAVLEF